MKLIADSGATKTSWCILNANGEIMKLETSGINPFFRDAVEIESELRERLLPFSSTIDSIFFYGAGIVNEEKSAIIKNILQLIYGEILIEIHSDLLGAARSVCDNKPGIVCILGTGSNACYFGGYEIIDHISPLGFILGDEGSGAALGKQLVSDYFKRFMPEHLRLRFNDQYKLEKENVLDRVYRSERPNHYLAQFSNFLTKHIEEAYCIDLIRQSFQSFIEKNVQTLSASPKIPIHFVGSVAYVFQDILKAVIQVEKLELGRIVKDPIDGLVQFHQKNQFS